MARRLLAACFCVLAATGCTKTWDFTPASPAEVRAQMGKDDVRVRIRRPQGEEIEWPIHVLERDCTGKSARCDLDVPGTKFAIGTPKTVPDGETIGLAAPNVLIAGLLVYGTVACFGEDACSTAGKVAIVAADVLFVGGVALALAMAAAWKNFRGD